MKPSQSFYFILSAFPAIASATTTVPTATPSQTDSNTAAQIVKALQKINTELSIDPVQVNLTQERKQNTAQSKEPKSASATTAATI